MNPGHSICNQLPTAADEESGINANATPPEPTQNYHYDSSKAGITGMLPGGSAGSPTIEADPSLGGSSYGGSQ
jgi:hypothetical protein